MRLVNKTGQHFCSEVFGGVEAPPDGIIEIEDGYCNARMAVSGQRMPSIAEQLLPGFVPEDEELRSRWGEHLRVTPLPVPSVREQAARLAVEESLPPAVAAQVASGEVAPPKRRRRVDSGAN